MTVASLDRVNLVLGGHTVLREVSLTLRAGEFVGLLGPNGGGKTTLLRALLGLVAPAAGAIRVLGAAARPGRAEIGYMPQRSEVPAPFLAGWEVVAAAAIGFGRFPVRGRAERRAIDRAIDLVGASHLARRPIGELSGGERQRLLLATALIGQPRLLLLDEPLASLDPAAQSELVGVIADAQRQAGCAVLCASHEINPLLPVIDRVLYLARGEAAIGAAAEVITGPVLSRLYGAPVAVVHALGRVFVLAEHAPAPPLRQAG